MAACEAKGHSICWNTVEFRGGCKDNFLKWFSSMQECMTFSFCFVVVGFFGVVFFCFFFLGGGGGVSLLLWGEEGGRFCCYVQSEAISTEQ